MPPSTSTFFAVRHLCWWATGCGGGGYPEKDSQPPAKKWRQPYSRMCGYVNSRIAITLVRATHRCIRGVQIADAQDQHTAPAVGGWHQGQTFQVGAPGDPQTQRSLHPTQPLRYIGPDGISRHINHKESTSKQLVAQRIPDRAKDGPTATDKGGEVTPTPHCL